MKKYANLYKLALAYMAHGPTEENVNICFRNFTPLARLSYNTELNLTVVWTQVVQSACIVHFL